LSNSCMFFLNVSVTGLRGRHHPALSNQLTTFDVSKSRPHLKMLCQDYLTYEKRADQSGGSPHCRCCNPGTDQPRPSESLVHILAECEQYSEVRDRIFPEMEYLCSRSNIDFKIISADKTNLSQFILDPTSLNLTTRVNMKDPNIESFFRKSRDFCYSIHNRRMKILKQKSEIPATFIK
jgi:hypothetical protein